MFAVPNPIEGDTTEQIAAFDAYSEAARALHELQTSRTSSPQEKRAALHNLLRLQKDLQRAFGAGDDAADLISLRRRYNELKASVRNAVSILRGAADLLAAEVEKELH